MPPTTRKTQTPSQSDPYAATAWGQSANDPTPTDLTVPSGQRCLVRRPGLEQLLREGVLFETDVHEHGLEALFDVADAAFVDAAD